MSHLPDAVRRAIRTFAFTFVGIFAVTLLGWLGDVVAWASSSSAAEFPSVSPLGKAAVAAAAAAASAVVTYIVNTLEDHTKLPALLKAPPSAGENPKPDAGD